MAGKNFAFKVAANATAAEAKEWTLDNCYTMTIYQVRQELTRRGIFDEIFGAEGEKRRISLNACLEVLVGELVKEKEERDRLRLAEVEAAKLADAEEGETLAQKLAREKAERKQAALERSKQRQASKAYFEERKKVNEENPAPPPKKSFWEKESSVTSASSERQAAEAGATEAEARPNGSSSGIGVEEEGGAEGVEKALANLEVAEEEKDPKEVATATPPSSGGDATSA